MLHQNKAFDTRKNSKNIFGDHKTYNAQTNKQRLQNTYTQRPATKLTCTWNKLHNGHKRGYFQTHQQHVYGTSSYIRSAVMLMNARVL